MISIVKIGNLEIKKKESGDGFRAYAVFEGDKVLLSDAHFKEAIDFVNQFPQNNAHDIDSQDTAHHLPQTIEAVFLYDRDSAQIVASMDRTEAELVFKEEINCIPKIGSILMMSQEASTDLIEKIIQSVEVIGQKTLIIFLGESKGP